MIGVSSSMASRIRNGRRLPSVTVLHRIQRAFDAPWEELIAAHRGGVREFGVYMRTLLRSAPSDDSEQVAA